MLTIKTSFTITCFLMLSCLSHASHPYTTLSRCLIASNSCFGKSMQCAATSIAGAALVGYIMGRSLSKKTPPSMAGTFCAAAAASLSACTVTPYLVYQKSGLTGLSWYALVAFFLIAYRETDEISKSMPSRQ